MLVRLIAPEWLLADNDVRKVYEGDYTQEKINELNQQGYNCYYLPNYPSHYEPHTTVDGSQIDVFTSVFVDFDLKSGTYASKEEFLDTIKGIDLPPTCVVDSGNGIHLYWAVSDLDALSFLRLQRRLCRFFKTDEAVSKIYQLMRIPNTYNTKIKDNFKECVILEACESEYTCEQLDKWLPRITKADEEYCQNHFNKTYRLEEKAVVSEKLPHKFAKLLKENSEVKQLFAGNVDDRSKADYRLAHILFAEGFSPNEAASVLVNCRKAIERSSVHRQNYALNIIEKVFTFEETKDSKNLSNSVKDILSRGKVILGTRLPCWDVFDATHNGFRLTQVLGLVGGSGSGKTTLAMNYFYHFAKRNPEYHHMFVSLEQPEEEIALRWVKICGENERLHEKVHVLGNYNSDGSFRNLSLQDVENYVLELEKAENIKIGCLVIDHVGALKKKGKDGENQGLMDIFHQMKSVAKNTNTFLVMQSQTSREKAGIGDLEIDKDGAYGSSVFEWYCDHLVTTWQPLKRIYDQMPSMVCSAFKYCKIRHKHAVLDKIKEDTVQVLMFDPDTERLRLMTDDEETSYDHWDKKATVIRNKDRRREPTRRTKIDWAAKGESNGATQDSKNQQRN